MIDYFAFLRGINVGGKNIIKMETLRKIFINCGFSDVKTYIQTGNVLFRYKKTRLALLSKKIEANVKEVMGNEVPVILRTREQLEEMVKIDPFKKVSGRQNTKLYVAFLSETPSVNINLPMKSERDGLELISIVNADAFLLSFEINGHYGFPNNFIEKLLKLTATSRYWNTIVKLLETELK
jgi:uncharacterized protein (DUF1697 family)